MKREGGEKFLSEDEARKEAEVLSKDVEGGHVRDYKAAERHQKTLKEIAERISQETGGSLPKEYVQDKAQIEWECQPPTCERIRIESIKKILEWEKKLKKTKMKDEANSAHGWARQGAISYWVNHLGHSSGSVNPNNVEEILEELTRESFNWTKFLNF